MDVRLERTGERELGYVLTIRSTRPRALRMAGTVEVRTVSYESGDIGTARASADRRPNANGEGAECRPVLLETGHELQQAGTITLSEGASVADVVAVEVTAIVREVDYDCSLVGERSFVRTIYLVGSRPQ